MRLAVVRHKNDDDVQVLVFLLELMKVGGMMIWPKDEDDPLHGSLDPLAVHLLDLVFCLALHDVDRLLNGIERVLFHFLVAYLGITHACSVLLQVLLVQFL